MLTSFFKSLHPQVNPKKKRAKVYVQLHKLRRKIKQLQEGTKSPSAKKEEIESLRGEVTVLEKELQSFQEGGHTTFLQAKKMLEPKKGISGKKHRIKWKQSQIEIRLKDVEEQLTEPDLEKELQNDLKAQIEKFRDQLDLLRQENEALEDYNHTRFVQARKDSGNTVGENRASKLSKIEGKISSIKQKLEKACEEGNEEGAEELQDDLHLLEMEKEAIENFSHELFLNNLDKLKAKRRSELR